MNLENMIWVRAFRFFQVATLDVVRATGVFEPNPPNPGHSHRNPGICVSCDKIKRLRNVFGVLNLRNSHQANVIARTASDVEITIVFTCIRLVLGSVDEEVRSDRYAVLMAIDE